MSKALRVLLAVGVLILFAGCSRRGQQDDPCAGVLRDSIAVLQVRLDTAVARYYRARDLYAQQIAVTAHIEVRVLYYARIVARRPASAKYMPAWARRAFAEALPRDSTPNQ